MGGGRVSTGDPDLRIAAFGLTLVREWLAATPSDREALRVQWPALADALDGLTWHPAPPGVGTGTIEAPKHPQNRSERAAQAPGDMHEPRPYPARHLHFE